MRTLILLFAGAALLASSFRQVVAQTPLDTFWDLVSDDSRTADAAERRILNEWDNAHASILVEMMRYVPDERSRRRITFLLERGTRQRLGRDLEGWWEWIWRTDPGMHPEYATFKAELYVLLDPSFADYFDQYPVANIRLDEIRWGGVPRDGIPPL
ncbi:MAG: hypothetical protein OXF01_04255, partial [Gemmatimonadetes bacterium]|nr:hypothetical protein [Gemmatimonadota bacterium]